jgi:hypothetical protein
VQVKQMFVQLDGYHLPCTSSSISRPAALGARERCTLTPEPPRPHHPALGRWVACHPSPPRSEGLQRGGAVHAQALPRRFHPQVCDKNRRDIGKSQSTRAAEHYGNAPLTMVPRRQWGPLPVQCRVQLSKKAPFRP